MKALSRKGGPWTKEALEVCIGLQLKFEAEDMTAEQITEEVIKSMKENYPVS
jgi:hypothetical protein